VAADWVGRFASAGDRTVSILAVIPVRGGSKGIPRKNLRDVAGKPLVVWTIEQALAARPHIDVLVSTDDAEIAAVAEDAGAQVPFLRPAELAVDTAATEPTVEHALAWWREHRGEPDGVMLLQATSPIRLPGTIDRAAQQFSSSGADSIVGVVPQTPFLWWASDPPSADYDVANRQRRQEISADRMRYRETGSLYVTKPRIYDELHNRLGGRIELFVMDDAEGVDIDTELDLAYVAAILGASPKRWQ